MQDSFQRLGVGSVNPFKGPHTQEPVLDVYTDAIIGMHGQTIKSLFTKSGCYIFVPKDTVDGHRVYQLSGAAESVQKCRLDIICVVQNVSAFIAQHKLELSAESVLKYIN